MNKSNNNKQEIGVLAALLARHNLAKQYLTELTRQDWQIDAVKWVWEKLEQHYAIYNTVPPTHILRDYSNDKSVDKVIQASVGSVLDSIENDFNEDDLAYYTSKVEETVRNTRIGNAILETAKTKEWSKLQEVVNKELQHTSKLPPLLPPNAYECKPSSDASNLLNAWALERQATIAIVAPTGLGKSVLTIQLAAAFSCGKEILGFRPNKAFKVLVVQSEDSDNDIALMRNGALDGLTEEQCTQVNENLRIVRLRGYAGKAFLGALDHYCDGHKPDIIFVNPLLKFFGGDPLNTLQVNEFLDATDLLLQKHNAGMIFIHHTIKQSKQSRMSQVDSSYSGFGSAAWSNGVRDTIELRISKSDGYFKLLTGKRSDKWGWREKYIMRYHIPTLPHWVEVSDEYVEAIKSTETESAGGRATKSDILQHIPTLPETISRSKLQLLTEKSEKTIRTYLQKLEMENVVGFQTSDAIQRGKPEKLYYRK